MMTNTEAIDSTKTNNKKESSNFYFEKGGWKTVYYPSYWGLRCADAQVEISKLTGETGQQVLLGLVIL